MAEIPLGMNREVVVFGLPEANLKPVAEEVKSATGVSDLFSSTGIVSVVRNLAQNRQDGTSAEWKDTVTELYAQVDYAEQSVRDLGFTGIKLARFDVAVPNPEYAPPKPGFRSSGKRVDGYTAFSGRRKLMPVAMDRMSPKAINQRPKGLDNLTVAVGFSIPMQALYGGVNTDSYPRFGGREHRERRRELAIWGY